MKLLKTMLVLFSLLFAAANAYVGKWHSLTNTDRVTSLVAHQGFLYAGTQGGIRRIDPATLEEKDYGNLDGLLDCWIIGLSETGDGTLWAVSKTGYLYSLSGDTWNAAGQSYVVDQWAMNDRAVFAAGQYVFLGSEKGLTIFDAVHRVAKANLTRFADQVDISILSMLAHGDTLFIGTAQGVYKAGVDFSNPFNTTKPGFSNLSDPSIWTKVVFPSGTAPTQFNSLAFVNGALAAFGPGTLLQDPVHVEAFTGQPAVIGTTHFNDSTTLNSALAVNGRIFLGGSHGLSECQNPLANPPVISGLPKASTFPSDTVYNVAIHGSQFWGQTQNGLYGINPSTGDTNQFVRFYTGAGGLIISPEFLYRHLRNLRTADNGDVYVGSWGGGLVRIRNGQQQHVWNTQSSPCLIEPAPAYLPVYAVSNLHKSDVFFTVFKGEGRSDHQLAYVNTTTDQIQCIDSTVPGGLPHVARIFSDSLMGVGSEQGVVFYKMREGAGSPILTALKSVPWTAPGGANETYGLAADQWERPWALMGDRLYYADSIDYPGSSLKLAEGFSGSTCYTLENDPLGTLWVGCSNGLFHIVPALTGIAKIDHYGLEEGLLSESISDISIDPSNGQVWIATDRGVNMLESSSQPVIADLQSVHVYPNPFRPQHRFAIFDNLPKNATVRIHTASGSTVRIFSPHDLIGNQAQWDGTNENHQPVAAGVYLFSVSSGSSVERGKIIVAR